MPITTLHAEKRLCKQSLERSKKRYMTTSESNIAPAYFALHNTHPWSDEGSSLSLMLFLFRRFAMQKRQALKVVSDEASLDSFQISNKENVDFD